MQFDEFDLMILKQRCARCDYEWFPRTKQTKRCPRCQTWYWHTQEKPKGSPAVAVNENQI